MGVPAFVVNDHNEVYSYWHNSIRGGTLLHVDAHADMLGGAEQYLSKDLEKYSLRLGIASFICPAVHYGVVKDVYWLNPHSEKLQKFYTDREVLETRVHPGYKYLVWKQRWPQVAPLQDGLDLKVLKGLGDPLILDVDLDAFCCHRHVEDVHDLSYRGIEGWEQRLEETIRSLEGIELDLVTIARSQGAGYGGSWVPPEMVDKVQEKFISELGEKYKLNVNLNY